MATVKTPKSLLNHKAYQDEYRRRLIRFGQPYLLASSIIEPFLRKIVDHGAFYLRMPRPALPLVLDSKCIKSQVETDEGRTEGGAETRREVTRQLFGADIDKMHAADFPKYGYLSCPNPKLELFMGDEMSFQYGNVLLTLKKDRLIHRTTMTVGMSLLFNVSERIVPTRTDNITATCIPGVSTDPKAPLNPRDLGAYMYLAEAIATRRITVDNFHRITEILGPDIPTFTYFELQYHGPLTLADIERIDVYSEDDNDYLDQMKARCSAAGIPFEVHSL